MLGYTPLPPAQCMLGYGQQAGDTHPTGMHSCNLSLVSFLLSTSVKQNINLKTLLAKVVISCLREHYDLR